MALVGACAGGTLPDLQSADVLVPTPTPTDAARDQPASSVDSASLVDASDARAADVFDANDTRTPSGRAFCDDDRDCVALECGAAACDPLKCVAKLGARRKSCARLCGSHADCRADELCIADPTIDASCFPRCEWPADCITGFDCFDYFRTGDYLCVPAEWALGWTR